MNLNCFMKYFSILYYKVKVQLFPWLIKHHAMKTCESGMYGSTYSYLQH
jgi:hypothetical protein